MKAAGTLNRQRDAGHELVEEGVAETSTTDLIVIGEHRGDIGLDVPVIN